MNTKFNTRKPRNLKLKFTISRSGESHGGGGSKILDQFFISNKWTSKTVSILQVKQDPFQNKLILISRRQKQEEVDFGKKLFDLSGDSKGGRCL